jgi:hypothetical protein
VGSRRWEIVIGGVPLVLKTDRLSFIEDQTLLSDFGPLGSLPAGDGIQPWRHILRQLRLWH